jgi:hypothetical protein
MYQKSPILVGAAMGAVLVLGLTAVFGMIPRYGSKFTTVSETITQTNYSSHTVTTTTQLTIIATVTATRTSSYSRASAVALMVTSSHLLLQFTLTNSTISSGDNVTLHVRMTNTLTVQNNVPVDSSYAAVGFSWPPKFANCYEIYWAIPLGIAIFNGHVTSANIRNMTPLYLWHPGVTLGCPNTGVDS